MSGMIIASGLFPEYPCSTAVVDDHHHHNNHNHHNHEKNHHNNRRHNLPPPPPPPPPPLPPCGSPNSQRRNMSCSDMNAQHCMNSCIAYGKICPYITRMACQYATNTVQTLKKDSILFASLTEQGNDNNKEKSSACCDHGSFFTRIPASDIRIMEKIGEGGFSNVNRCLVKMKKKKKTTTTTNNKTMIDDTVTTSTTSETLSPEASPVVQEETAIEEYEQEQEYAIKYLRRKAMMELHQFKHGAADLVCEAYFLQALSHSNIVQLHGISCSSSSSSSCNSSNNSSSIDSNMINSFAMAATTANQNHHHHHRNGTGDSSSTDAEHSFYIVIDKLNDTLENKIHEWKCEKDKHSQNLQYANLMLLSRLTNPLFAQHDSKERKRTQLMERIQIALDIANAMEYLHSLNVIFRDLKPDNIGFTASGQLKLFDFGLAKELKSSLKNSNSIDETYNLTGNTGSRRYMAPEVALEKCYGKSVDVYSFGILIWEVLCAEKPFYGYSSDKHMQLVVLGGERPKMDVQHTSTWPCELVTLVNKCWSTCPNDRPTFTEIIHILNGILVPNSSSSHGAATTSSSSTTATVTTPGMLESSTQVIPLRPSNDNEDTRSSSESAAAASAAATTTTPPHTPINNGKTAITSSLSLSPLSALFRVTVSPLKPLRSQRSRSAGDHQHHGGGVKTTTTTTVPSPTPPLPLPPNGGEHVSFATMMPPPLSSSSSSTTATTNRRAKSWGFGLRR